MREESLGEIFFSEIVIRFKIRNPHLSGWLCEPTDKDITHISFSFFLGLGWFYLTTVKNESLKIRAQLKACLWKSRKRPLSLLGSIYEVLRGFFWEFFFKGISDSFYFIKEEWSFHRISRIIIYDRFILLPTIFSGNLLTPSEIKLIDIQKVILTRSYRVSYRMTFIAESGNEKKI